MSAIKNQVHTKFKVFVGELAADRSIGDLGAKVASFAKTTGAAAKSIGVEYLESLKKVVITLGYRTDETPYPIRLQSVPVGKLHVLANDFSALETAMANAAENTPTSSATNYTSLKTRTSCAHDARGMRRLRTFSPTAPLDDFLLPGPPAAHSP